MLGEWVLYRRRVVCAYSRYLSVCPRDNVKDAEEGGREWGDEEEG